MSEKKEEILEEKEEEVKEEIVEKKEVEERKKHPFMNTVMIIVLFCVFMGIGFALGGISTANDVKGTSTGNNTVNNGTSKTDSLKEIESDSLIEALWNRVNFYGMLNINNYRELNYDGLKVSEMSDEMKGFLASKYFSGKADFAGTNKVKVYESDVRYGYDSLFGAGTYKSGQKIYGACADYTYNSEDKVYEPACGGTSDAGFVEKITKIEKNSSELKISSVLGFYNYTDDKLYKTIDDAFNKKDAAEDNSIDYLIKNKESYNQYVYTFSIEPDGFYKYLGYEKVK